MLQDHKYVFHFNLVVHTFSQAMTTKRDFEANIGLIAAMFELLSVERYIQLKASWYR